MRPLLQLLRSSLGKKYLMAVTGLVLVLFVLQHMLGNVQIFLGPEVINAYAHKLQSLPAGVIWGVRLFLLLCVVVHVWMAVLVTIENRRARPDNYTVKENVQNTYAARTMPVTGLILMAFIIFHILHYTARVIYDYSNMPYDLHGESVHDVYSMMIQGFSHWWVSIFYIISVWLLCMHLSHGVSSMFQSVGLRNEKWRGILDKVAVAYGWIVFLGFASIPAAVMAGLIKPL